MKTTRRRFLTVFASATFARTTLASTTLAAASTAASREEQITRQRFYALGTDAQITLLGKRTQAEAALKACKEEVAAIEAAFSLYDSDSMLSKLNRNGYVKTNGIFSTLVTHALKMAEATGGAFDPTIQPLWQALATDSDLAQAQNLVDWRGLMLKPDKAYFSQPNMAASFNGIAQGFAADQVSAILAQHGFKNTLVDIGEFAVRGIKWGKPWLIGIREPITGQIITQIETSAGAIATSEPNGTLIKGHQHIIDPLERTGERWASVTVEANEAWRADALSTAIAASPLVNAENLLVAGDATRAWLINASGTLSQWRKI